MMEVIVRKSWNLAETFLIVTVQTLLAILVYFKFVLFLIDLKSIAIHILDKG